MATRALVLGGGGIFGIAWETGLLAGLAAGGLELVPGADVIIGTSAGSTVAAQVTGGVPLTLLYDRQLEPADGELTASLDTDALQRMFTDAMTAAGTGAGRRAVLGRLALEAVTPPEAARLEVIRGRLPRHTWPERDVRLVIVDAQTGEPRVIDRSSGVSLVDAVAASCAVPGVWPPVTIDGRRYIDGGVRSTSNADLAAGHDIVLALVPMMETGGFFDPEVGAALDQLTGRPGTCFVSPDDASVAAGGANPLDPATRAASARAGHAQAAAVIDQARAVWEA